MSPVRSYSLAAPRRPWVARGFTLLEVLIAFFVLSIGLMGVAGLQSLSKTSQHEAIQRTRAVTLADMVIEMIRNNPLGVVAYDTGGVALGGGTIGTAPSPDCISGDCTPAQLAARNLWEFEQALDGLNVSFDSGGTPVGTGGLREPAACITFTPVGGLVRSGQVDVRIQWRGLESTSDAVTDAVDFCAGAAVGTDPFRRQVAVGTYIVDETEL